MTQFMSDIENIAFYIQKDDIVKALDCWLNSYHNISVEQFMECVDIWSKNQYTPSDIVVIIENMENTLSTAKSTILNHYGV